MSSYRRQLERARRGRVLAVTAPPPRPLRRVRTGDTIGGYPGETVAVVGDVDGAELVLGHVYIADGGRLKISPDLRVVDGRIEAR